MNDVAQDRLALIRSLNAMDDQFFRKLAEDEDVCEEILRTVLDDDCLTVEESIVQDSLNNLMARSVIVDALCLMGDGTRCCVEVQRADDADHLRRVRYIRSSTEVAFTDKGSSYGDLPRVVVVFISSFDPIGAGFTTYHIDKVVRETGKKLDDGTLDVYVNSAVDDGSRVARLMTYMENSNGNNPEFPHLSGRISYFKETEEGESNMSDLVEEYAKEYASKQVLDAMIEAVRNTMERGGMALDAAMNLLGIPESMVPDVRLSLGA